MATPRRGGGNASSSKRPTSPSSGQEPGKEIGEFRRGREIGKGSFANVYLAQHCQKKSLAAVKVVQMSRLTDRLKLNLESEIDLLKKMKHPHIVALFETKPTTLWYYLIMEYCPLSDLSQFLKKRHSLGNLPETADIFRRYPNPTYGGFHEVIVRHFIKQIASALQYLRNHNLIHRDIKPQNLLLNPAPSYMARQRPEDVPLAASEHSLTSPVGLPTLPMLKIADFGFARHLASTSMAETLCGSPLYMAPEILRYEKYDARVDLWSAGGVLYEMVVGKPPFRAQNHVELLKRIEKANDQIIFDNRNMRISRHMKTVIRGLLTCNPLGRMSHEELFAHPLITEDIPGLVEEDRRQITPAAAAEMAEVGKKLAARTIDPSPDSRPPVEPPRSRTSVDDPSRNPDPTTTHRSSRPSRRTSGEHARAVRPGVLTHATAPGRQELVGVPAPVPESSQPVPIRERRTSRPSPLAGLPILRESSTAHHHSPPSAREDRATREARERTAHDVTVEKEYVLVEKRAVEINAFADELNACRGSPSSQPPVGLSRRATTHGGSLPAQHSHSPTAATAPRPAHQRHASFERRSVQAPPSATNMLTKAFNAANVRLFGAVGSSPPLGTSASPPRGYGAFPTYPTAHPPADAVSAPSPAALDDESKMVIAMEDAAHRSDVIFGFAEVKYRQLLPATPSASDDLPHGLGIPPSADPIAPADDPPGPDPDLAPLATVAVAQEALVLYVKTLSILARTIDLAGAWWRSTNTTASSTRPRPNPVLGRRINHIVQWARTRFNSVLDKSLLVSRRLHAARHALVHGSDGPPPPPPPEVIPIDPDVSAPRLLFDRAVEMSRAAAVEELVGRDLVGCEVAYTTAVVMLEAVVEEGEDEGEGGEELGEVGRGEATKVLDATRRRLRALKRKLPNAGAGAGANAGAGATPPRALPPEESSREREGHGQKRRGFSFGGAG